MKFTAIAINVKLFVVLAGCLASSTPFICDHCRDRSGRRTRVPTYRCRLFETIMTTMIIIIKLNIFGRLCGRICGFVACSTIYFSSPAAKRSSYRATTTIDYGWRRGGSSGDSFSAFFRENDTSLEAHFWRSGYCRRCRPLLCWARWCCWENQKGAFRTIFRSQIYGNKDARVITRMLRSR